VRGEDAVPGVAGALTMRRLLVVAAACTVLVGPGQALAAPGPLPLVPCGTRLCGTLTVPLDRSLPAGPTIGVHVEVIPAGLPAYRGRQAFFALAGGPGDAAAKLGTLATSYFYDVAQTHDVVLVDQRGTGESNPLFCPFAGLVGYDAPPAWITAYWSECLGALDADPGTYTTAVAMQDVDDVRAALGYDRIDLYGISYGATAAQYYLLQFPEHVRTVVFDSGTELDIPVFERWGTNAQQMLDTLFARCAHDHACHKTFPSPAKDLRTVLARLAKSPAHANSVTVTPAVFAVGIQQLSRDPSQAAMIPLLLRRAVTKGIAAVAPSMQLLKPGFDTELMPTAIECDEPWALRDATRIAALDKGSYLAAADVAAATVNRAVCAAFPTYHDVAGADGPVRSEVPALWLVGSGDPQDPLANVAGVKAAMPNVKIVVGHGTPNAGARGGVCPANTTSAG